MGETLSVLLGRGGWLRLADAGAVVLARVAEERPGGRLGVVEVHVVGDPTVTGELLRSVPVAALDAVVNGPRVADEVRASIAAGDPTGGLDWSAIGARVQVSPGPGAAVQGWHGKDPAEPGVGLIVDANAYTDGVASIWAEMPDRTRDFKVKMPKMPRGRRRPDDFYERVAEVYTLAAAHTPGPALLLAKANGVPVSTIHRWIREARARGILPPGQSRPVTEPETDEPDPKRVVELMDALGDTLERNATEPETTTRRRKQ